MNHLLKCAVILLALSAFTCYRPNCKNTNAVFDTNLPGTKPYNDELLKQIDQKPGKVTYWFDKYEQREGKEFLYVHILGDSLCAKGVMAVTDNTANLKELQKTKGTGYSGAQLRKLQFTIYRDSTRTDLIFKNVAEIVD